MYRRQPQNISFCSECQTNLTLKWKTFVKKICCEWTDLMFFFPFDKGIKDAVLHVSHLCVLNEAQASDHSSESNYFVAQKSLLHMAAKGIHVVESVPHCTFHSPKRKVQHERKHMLKMRVTFQNHLLTHKKFGLRPNQKHLSHNNSKHK